MGNIGFRKAKCKDCFKCVRICPVKAVRRRNERAQFMARECIQCGLCLESCPQHAISVFSDIDKIKEYFAKGEKVVVTISPAYLGIIDDESFHNIKRLSKQYFTIKDVSLGDFISSLTLNEGYNDNRKIQNGYKNVIMKCVCNSNSLVFYDNSKFHSTDSFYQNKIENHSNITINENDSKFNKPEIKKEENKLNIIITNDEFLI